MAKKSKITISNDSEIIEKNILPPTDTVAYNELRSSADLFRMFMQEQIEIEPEFQREMGIWPEVNKTRFIDSLCKGLPIPSMCLSFDSQKKKFKVIDGLQRISTIIKFLDTKKTWRLNEVEDVAPTLSGKTNIELESTSIFSDVQNATIPVTIIRCDYTKENHMEYLYTIFNRLNTQGTKLNGQEIRNCIFSGDLNHLLKELVKSKEWVQLASKVITTKKARYKHEELILRCLAFSENFESYQGKISLFLNSYMQGRRDLPTADLITIKNNFYTVINKITEFDIPEKMSNSVFEALFVGVYNSIILKNRNNLNFNYIIFKKLDSFSADKLREGLGVKSKMSDRFTEVENYLSRAKT